MMVSAAGRLDLRTVHTLSLSDDQANAHVCSDVFVIIL